MRYYLRNSSIFDNPDTHYDIDLFKAAVSRGGGTNVRHSYELGWANRPKVVTWNGSPEINKKIDKELCKVLQQFEKWGPIIFKQEW